jgi:hypothetical protein
LFLDLLLAFAVLPLQERQGVGTTSGKIAEARPLSGGSAPFSTAIDAGLKALLRLCGTKWLTLRAATLVPPRFRNVDQPPSH